MKNRRSKDATDNPLQKYRLKIESEECRLVLALRKAEEQLRRSNRCSGDETEPGAEDEKEALTTKSNFYRHRLQSVRQSLGRLRSGRFGLCASCGEEIGEKRLSAIPTALYCLECQEAYERERAISASLR